MAAVLLLVIGFAMLFLGINNNILPPALTGIGFLVIAAVCWKLK